MAKKQLTAEQEKEIKMLKATQEMLERTKREAKRRGSDDNTLAQLDDAQNDVYKQIGNIDVNLIKEVQDEIARGTEVETITLTNKKKKSKPISEIISEHVTEAETTTKTASIIDTNVQYDVIPLPSNGECYKDKMSKIPVSYLTAYDENILTSPNLYKDGLVIDVLLKNKILKENFNVDDLCSGDADAIVLFLRATSYGTDFPVTVNDPKTGKSFETVIDLSKIKYKQFELNGDENGWFTFVLPMSGDEVKFKYLTRKENKMLEILIKNEAQGSIVSMLERNTNEIITVLNRDGLLDESEKASLKDYVTKIQSWASKIGEKNDINYSLAVTNKMELEIQSINGNTDRLFIHEYVKNMRAKDSMELRRFISKHEPGLDFSVEVDRPIEFGGGSFNTFLEWDDTIFLNYT